MTTTKNQHIKFVYFDQGGVMFTESPIQDLATELNVPYDSFRHVYAKYSQSVCAGEITADQLWQKYRQEIGFDYDLTDYNDWWFSRSQPILPVHELARKLIGKVDIGLLTNTYQGFKDHIFSKARVPQLAYKAIIASCEVGTLKPEAKIYELAETAAGVDGGEIFFIDNSPRFIEAAQQRGWQTFLFDSHKPQSSVNAIADRLSL